MSMTSDEIEKLEEDYISCLKSGRQKIYEIDVLARENRRLQADNASLRALARFGRWSLGFHLEGYHEKYSSYDRDAAFDLGILEEVRVEKPCSDNCQCKFYDNVFPRNCVRETPLAQLPEKRDER